MKRWINTAPVIVLLLAVSPPLAAQDWAGAERVKGVVLDESDAPIAGATVTLQFELSSSAGGPKPMTTDKKGRWSAIGLKPGSWRIDIEAEGYYSRDARFTVYDTGVNETVRLNLEEVPEEVKQAELRSEANEVIEQGNQLASEGRFAEARAEYAKALEVLPETDHPPILAGIASSYFKEGDNESANEALERALAIDPDDELSLRLKIAALAAEGKVSEVEALRARLPSEADLDPNAELNLGVLRYNEGDLDGALEIFERVRAKRPEIADAHYYCGLVYLGQEQSDSALEAFREVLVLEPEHAKAAEVRDFIAYLESASD